MDRIKITGGERLNGELTISGAKNATLPLMIASLLTEETLTLENVPRLADVNTLERLLRTLGVNSAYDGRKPGSSHEGGDTLHLTAGQNIDTVAPYDLVSRMRASFWVLGPMIARCHTARVSLPGGCAIGTRPVDLYLMALEKLGAQLSLEDGYVVANAPGGLKGNVIEFPFVSVGATHTALMASVLASGETIIKNAAREPEVVDLGECLIKMGAQISGLGTSTVTIQGVKRLGGARHSVLPDRIETGTYAMAVAMTGGNVLLRGARADLLEAVLPVIEAAGANVEIENEGIRITRNGASLKPVKVNTAPYPGFPTDMQAQLMALMTKADGVSEIRETIFENRFMHVSELSRLGADISLKGDQATVTGVGELNGATVMATDLRASVSLVIAGLVASGETIIGRVYHLDRGFERIEQKLGQCGAKIERLSE